MTTAVLFAAFLGASLASPSGAPRPQESDAFLARVRDVLGAPAAKPWRARGTARYLGQDGRFEFLGAPDGRFALRVAARAGETLVYDGRELWRVDAQGIAQVLECEDFEHERALGALLTSTCFAPASPLVFEPQAALQSDGARVLTARVGAGLRRVRLVLDATTLLPLRAELGSVRGPETWLLGPWRRADGPDSARFPERFERSDGRRSEAYALEALEPAPDFEAALAALTPSAPGPARAPRWIEGAGARVPLTRARSGHLLFHPRLAGRDVGAFVLDSGAAVTLLRRDVADALGLERFGELKLGGVGAATFQAAFRARGESGSGVPLEVGPLAIDDVLFLEGEVPALAAAIGEPIAGILGYDLFARAVVELDFDTPAMVLHRREGFADAALTWNPLVLHGRHPHLLGSIEDSCEGLLRFDTGMGSMAALLHGPAVERCHLLDGRATSEVVIGGAGGSARARLGELASVSVAGQRVERAQALFLADDTDASGDPYSLATFGPALLAGRRLWLDYAGRRAALAP